MSVRFALPAVVASCVVVIILGLLAYEVRTMATRDHEPAWAIECRSRLDEAADSLTQEDPSLYSDRAVYQDFTNCAFEPANAVVCLTSDRVTACAGLGRHTLRRDPARRAGSYSEMSDRGLSPHAHAVLRAALDACGAEMPTGFPDEDDPSWAQECRAHTPAKQDVCVAAMRATREIATTCWSGGSSVGFAGTPSRDYLSMKQLLELGDDASPFLAELSRSPNPAARYWFTRATAVVTNPELDVDLDRLTRDPEIASTMSGCLDYPKPISEAARLALWARHGYVDSTGLAKPPDVE